MTRRARVVVLALVTAPALYVAAALAVASDPTGAIGIGLIVGATWGLEAMRWGRGAPSGLLCAVRQAEADRETQARIAAFSGDLDGRTMATKPAANITDTDLRAMQDAINALLARIDAIYGGDSWRTGTTRGKTK